MIKKEWQRLIHNPLLIVVLMAIILIPSIYAGFFLASMWDPYGELDKLPVAVVNKDQPVMYDGEEIAIGDELVKNLKEDASLDFHFVDEASAKQGLKSGQYYMIITIPEDFSHNATTVLDDKPSKMDLQYETDPATNYVAMKLSESAMTKMELSLERKVTETYAETLFTKLTTLGNSLDEASEGTSKILDGENAISDGVDQLSEGTSALLDGATQLSDGTSTLSNGASQLNEGLVTYMDGTDRIDNGAKTLSTGATSLKSGASQVNSGAAALSDGTSKAYSAATSIDDGANALKNGSKDLSDGMTSLQSGASDLSSGASTLAAGASDIATGASDLSTGLDSLNSSMPVMTGALSELDTGAASLKSGIKTYTDNVDLIASSSSKLSTGLTTLDGAVNGENGLKASSAQFKTNLDNLSASADYLASTGVIPQELADNIKSLDTAYASLDGAISSQGGLGDSVAALSQGATNLNSGLNTLVGEDNCNSEALRTGSSDLSGGITLLNNSASTMADGVDKLATGASALKDGTSALSNGATGLSTGASTLSDGADKIAAGASTLSDGAATLADGTDKLKSGMSDLNDGAATLATGTATLSSGADTLANGATTLADGTSTLVSNNETILTGASDLKDGADKLATGASDLKNGASDLNDGMNTLSDSMPDLIDGTSTLYDGLSEGADKLENTNKNEANAQMFSNPLETTETKLTNVSDNGHAMAAYMMSVGLWVACLAFCLMYPLTEHDSMDSGFKWWLSKASVLYPMAILQAVVLVLILHFTLGFAPARLGQTILVACLASVAFMSIMYFFNVLLGKVGSFIMLIFMVLQLAGSAGTYPIEVSGPLAAALNRFMPFTYTVAAFRSSIGGGEPFPMSVRILLLIFLASTLLTVFLFVIRGKKEQKGKTNLYDVMEAHGFA
ncbi:MAG: YhgE/Pip domain-containing protein [Clostridiales bacterium]|nr:YhgE/Pip domain-containing protein [Clostridiales bacterium]